MLTETENKVTAFFLEESEILKDVPQPHRNKILFSEETRKKCRETLNIKTSQFNFLISSLKKKGILVKTQEGFSLPLILQQITEDTIGIKYEITFI